MNLKSKIALITGASSGMGQTTAQRLASRMRMRRRFAPASVIDAGVRKDLRLEA